MNPLCGHIDDPLSRYFRSLGYDVTWDFRAATKEYWYEIYHCDASIAQIDMGIPLRTVHRDLCCWARGEDSPEDGPTYKINAPDGPWWSELLQRVAANEPVITTEDEELRPTFGGQQEVAL